MFGKRERLYADTRIAEQEQQPVDSPRQVAPPAEPAPTPRPAEPPPVTGKPSKEVSPRQQGRLQGPLSTVLELAGVATVSVGGFLVAPWLGCMMLGILLILLGVAIGNGA